MEKPYNVIAKFNSEQKKLLSALQSHYIVKKHKMISKAKTISLAVIEACESLNIKAKQSPAPESTQKTTPDPDFSSLLEKTKDAEDGFSSLKDIKKALGLFDSDKKVASMLKAAGFERRIFRNKRGWLAKIKPTTN